MSNIRNFHLIISFFLFFIGLTTSCYANLIRDAEIEAKLEAFLEPLLNKANISSQIKVRLILNSSYNAFVTSDNIIYLHSGLLLKAESLEEVIGVMAHELGHIVSGHVARKNESLEVARNASSLSTALAAAAAIGGSEELAASLLIGGNDRVARNYYYGSRINEAIADEWALKMLDELQISAAGMARMMKRLSNENALPESYQSEYYRTHPEAKKRLAVYKDHLTKSNFTNNRMNVVDYASFKRIVGKISSYEKRPEEIIQNLKNDTLSSDEMYQRAIAYLRYGSLEKASKDVSSLLIAEPNNPYFYELAGEIAFADGLLSSAIKYFEEAFNKSGGAPLIALRLGRVFLSADSSEYYFNAREILKIAVDGEPKLPFARREYATALGKTGDLASANLQLAEASYLSNDLPQATKHLERALKIPNLNPKLEKSLKDLKFLIQDSQTLKTK